ncbi:nucleotide-binding alpha-beta plait domain-containing protein [Tanacetum coccineum]
MGSFRSKEDDVAKISTSIFVLNFLDFVSAKDLFHSCKQYGHVVDSFIPMKRLKDGKRFGFVRFINVFNVERLVNNLCTIWLNRCKLHANIARFNRDQKNGNKYNTGNQKKHEGRKNTFYDPSKEAGTFDSRNSFVNVLKGTNMVKETDSSPVIVLEEDCLNSKDLSNSLIGRVKDVGSLSNLKKVLCNEENETWFIHCPTDGANLLMQYFGWAGLDDSPWAVRRLPKPCIVLPTKKNRLEGDPGPEPRDPPSDGQYEEVQKKSLREFHKTHRSGSGTVTKIALSTAKIKSSVTNEGTGVKPGVPDVTDEESTERSDQERDSGDDKAQFDSKKGSDSEHETDENESGSESDQKENGEEIEDAEEEEEDEFVKTSSNDTEDEDKTKIKDKTKGDEDERMDYATNQFDDDVNVRLNEPVDTDEGLIQKEGTDAEMTNVKEGNGNLEITLDQVIEDAHMTLSTVP